MKTEHKRKQPIVFSYSLPTNTTTSPIRRMNSRSRSLTTEYSEPYFRSMNLSSSSLSPTSVNNTSARQEIRMKTPIWPKTRVTPTNTRPNTITRQKWTLQQSDIYTLPYLYPLDRSHIVLKDDVSVATLCKRITESMRVQNIVGLWDMSYPSKIRCDSDKMLLFEINVWKKKKKNNNKSRSKSVSFCGDNEDDGGKEEEDNNGSLFLSSNLIVEIHYLSGDALEFHRVKSNLWNAIDDGLDQQSSTGTSTLPKHCRPPLPKFLDDIKTTSSPTTTTSSSSSSSFDMMALNETLSTTKELCDRDTLFHRKMALEILSFSTDTSITNRAFATHMSKVIVLGLNPIGRCLRDVIRSEIVNFDTTNDDNDDDDGSIPTFKRMDDRDIVQNTIHAIHQEAIKVLNNAFSLVIQHCQFQSSLDKVSKEVNEFWIQIIPALIYDLDHVSIRPHMANVSSKCLKNVCLLLNMSTTSLDTNGQRGGVGRGGGGGVVKKEEILPVVERALVYGKENYFSLEKESLNLMMVLSQ